MLRYAITDLTQSIPERSPAAARERQAKLLKLMERWSADGVDYVQLREKALDAGEQFALASAGIALLHKLPARHTRFLLSGRADIAAAARADGVHLTDRPGELTPSQIHRIFTAAGLPQPVVSVSCHTLADISAAQGGGADLLLFGPVFGKQVASESVLPGIGLGVLQQAALAARPVPLLALGGVTSETTAACLDAGAAGIAGIRLFG